jgi:outer membrane protein
MERALQALLLGCCLLAVAAAGRADTPALPASPAAPLVHGAGSDPCATAAVGKPLSLVEAVTRALCWHPKTREAWAAVRVSAAAVRIGKEGYLPTVGATGKGLEYSTQTHLNNAPALNTSARGSYPEGSAALSWTLFDFGQRQDQLESARQLLAAAQATLDLNLQQVFLQTAADYYDAQAAQATLESTKVLEDIAHRSVGAAHVRVERGVAPISDELQAQTAAAQAVVNRVKAEEELNSKRGALAGDMGFEPDHPLVVPVAAPDIAVDAGFAASLRELIEQAKRSHPSVVVAEHELAAARLDEAAARAHGYPTLSAVGTLSRSNQPLTPSLGSPSVPGHVSSWSYGIQLDVPLSDALWKRGAVAKAHAQVQAQEEALYGAEQKVAQDVWLSYTALQADTDNVTNLAALLASARKSFEATQRRYEGGAGNILELLSSQSAYANAEQQHIKALSDWRIARLALVASLGRLDLTSIEDGR